MILGRTHPGLLGLLWIADVMLLLMLVPDDPDGRSLVIALVLWLVPTAALAAGTWRWWRHAGG